MSLTGSKQKTPPKTFRTGGRKESEGGAPQGDPWPKETLRNTFLTTSAECQRKGSGKENKKNQFAPRFKVRTRPSQGRQSQREQKLSQGRTNRKRPSDRRKRLCWTRKKDDKTKGRGSLTAHFEGQAQWGELAEKETG